MEIYGKWTSCYNNRPHFVCWHVCGNVGVRHKENNRPDRNKDGTLHCFHQISKFVSFSYNILHVLQKDSSILERTCVPLLGNHRHHEKLLFSSALYKKNNTTILIVATLIQVCRHISHLYVKLSGGLFACLDIKANPVIWSGNCRLWLKSDYGPMLNAPLNLL